MTPAAIAAYIQRITYKPGWRLCAEPWHWDQVRLLIKWEAPCAFTGQPCVQVSASHIIDLLCIRDERDVLTQVLWAIKRAEEHETLEFLKLDGVAPFDPHRHDHIERQPT